MWDEEKEEGLESGPLLEQLTPVGAALAISVHGPPGRQLQNHIGKMHNGTRLAGWISTWVTLTLGASVPMVQRGNKPKTNQCAKDQKDGRDFYGSRVLMT